MGRGSGIRLLPAGVESHNAGAPHPMPAHAPIAADSIFLYPLVAVLRFRASTSLGSTAGHAWTPLALSLLGQPIFFARHPVSLSSRNKRKLSTMVCDLRMMDEYHGRISLRSALGGHRKLEDPAIGHRAVYSVILRVLSFPA